MTTKRADIPVFYTLGTSVELWGRRHEVWAYWLKLGKGEVQAYHHNVSVKPQLRQIYKAYTTTVFGRAGECTQMCMHAQSVWSYDAR